MVFTQPFSCLEGFASLLMKLCTCSHHAKTLSTSKQPRPLPHYIRGTDAMMGTPVKSPAVGLSTMGMETEALVDYPSLEEMDPSLVDGFQVFYEREVPFELRSASTVDMPNEVGALEAIRVKILVRGQPNKLDAVRVELGSESNLFFHYASDMDTKAFAEMQEQQRLMVDFGDYPTMLLRMLNQCIREPHIHLAVFVMQPSGEARLDFIQNMEYKFVELLSCRFMASSEEVVRAQVSYRYNVVKARMQLLQARLADINAMVKVKNPSLLLQLQRTPPKLPGSALPPGVNYPAAAGAGGGGSPGAGIYGGGGGGGMMGLPSPGQLSAGSTGVSLTPGGPRPFRA